MYIRTVCAKYRIVWDHDWNILWLDHSMNKFSSSYDSVPFFSPWSLLFFSCSDERYLFPALPWKRLLTFAGESYQSLTCKVVLQLLTKQFAGSKGLEMWGNKRQGMGWLGWSTAMAKAQWTIYWDWNLTSHPTGPKQLAQLSSQILSDT